MELARGTINNLDCVSRVGFLEGDGDFIHGELEISSRGHGDFFGLCGATQQNGTSKQQRLNKLHNDSFRGLALVSRATNILRTH